MSNNFLLAGTIEAIHSGKTNNGHPMHTIQLRERKFDRVISINKFGDNILHRTGDDVLINGSINSFINTYKNETNMRHNINAWNVMLNPSGVAVNHLAIIAKYLTYNRKESGNKDIYEVQLVDKNQKGNMIDFVGIFYTSGADKVLAELKEDSQVEVVGKISSSAEGTNCFIFDNITAIGEPESEQPPDNKDLNSSDIPF